MEITTKEFKQPIRIQNTVLTHKEFILKDIDGTEFELSVLPGLHQISIKDAWSECEPLISQLLKSTKTIDFEKDYFGLIEHKVVSAPSMFALEAWLFNRAKVSQTPPWNLEVKQNALLYTPDLSVLQSKRLAGFTCFKLKIARQESAHDISNFLAALLPHETVRLDANRGLTPEHLATLLNNLKPYWSQIEYIEEPFATFKEHQAWVHPIALALDESASLLKESIPTSVKYAVIKPTLWGFSSSVRAINEFNNRGCKVTLSGTYELSTAHKAILSLASVQNTRLPNPAGLDTFNVFK